MLDLPLVCNGNCHSNRDHTRLFASVLGVTLVTVNKVDGVCILFNGPAVSQIRYAVAYQSDPSKRGAGFTLSLLAFAGLAAGALWGVAKVLLQ